MNTICILNEKQKTKKAVHTPIQKMRKQWCESKENNIHLEFSQNE